MKLYYSPGACSLAIHILMRETGLPLELVKVDLASHKLADGTDYYLINSKGAVPLLELDSGERLSEGPVIAQYLCDLANRSELMPQPGSMLRYRVMEWQNFITAELHKSFSPLFNPGFDDKAKELVRDNLRRKYDWLNRQLRASVYLTGDVFTAADAYLYTVTRWASVMKLDLSEFGEIRQYMDRVASRPAVQAALKAEGLA